MCRFGVHSPNKSCIYLNKSGNLNLTTNPGVAKILFILFKSSQIIKKIIVIMSTILVKFGSSAACRLQQKRKQVKSLYR